MAQYNSPPKQKALKQDEFISFFDHLIIYFARHRSLLLLLVVAAVLALGAYALYRYQVGRAVQNFALDYMKAEKAPDSEAIQVWKTLEQKSPPAQLSALIALQMGGDYAKNKQWADATAVFKRNNDAASLLKPLNQLAYATSLENSQQYSQAHEIYQKLSQEKGSPFQQEARLGVARSLLGMQQTSDAETLLLQLIAKGSDAPPSVKSAALNELIAIRLKSSK